MIGVMFVNGVCYVQTEEDDEYPETGTIQIPGGQRPSR